MYLMLILLMAFEFGDVKKASLSLTVVPSSVFLVLFLTVLPTS